jgi:hypothetical protein
VKLVAPLLAAFLLFGCSKNIQNPEAVRSAIMEYLNARAAQTGLDMSAMQVEVGATTFEKDTARATVSITPKSTGGPGMQMMYNLDRKGDKWVVRAGGSPHGMPGGVPPSAAPGQDGGAPQGGQALPPGHPPVGKQ